MQTERCVQVGGGCKLDFFLSSLLYGTPAPSSESQLLVVWPASIYGHLREGYLSVPCELSHRLILSKLAFRQVQRQIIICSAGGMG